MIKCKSMAVIIAILSVVCVTTAAAVPWVCSLPDTIQCNRSTVTLGDISQTLVPALAAEVVLTSSGTPGTVLPIARQTILRRLVGLHLASGVSFKGAETCMVMFGGTVVKEDEVRRLLKEKLEPMLPTSEPGAPVTWLELEYRHGELAVQGLFNLTPMMAGKLRPGRQQVRFRFQEGNREHVLPVNVVVHHYGEIARAGHRIVHGASLRPADFVWEWMDLADGTKGRLIGRRILTGKNAARTMTTGTVLREEDLKLPPVVLAGDPVELKLSRGGVLVTVRAFARRDGVIGQTIPVLNDLTGKLINARVVGPGRVEWRY